MSTSFEGLPNTDGVVLYTDGGCKPKPGAYGAWAVHGYLYSNEVPKQGTGAKAKPSALGYGMAGNTDIKVHHYVDMAGTVENTTNNAVEAMALEQALQWTVQLREHTMKPLHVVIRADSQYVLNSYTQYIDQWKKNGWKKRDGSEIANVDVWQRVDVLRDKLIDLNQEITATWVKGHSGDVGNEKADTLCSQTMNWYNNGHQRLEYTLTPSQGYWKPQAEARKWFYESRFYFSSQETHEHEGYHFYRLGRHGKPKPGKKKTDAEIERAKRELNAQLGKALPDTIFCVMATKTPDPVLNTLRDYHLKHLSACDLGHVTIVQMDGVLNPKVYSSLVDHGIKELRFEPKDQATYHATQKELCRTQNPPYLSLRAKQHFDQLSKRLVRYMSGTQHEQERVVDITHLLFSKSVDKKGKEQVKHINHQTPCVSTQAVVWGESGDRSVEVVLTFDVDLPKHRILHGVCGELPAVKLVTWPVGGGLFEYAIYMHTSVDHGIWRSVFSSFSLLPPLT